MGSLLSKLKSKKGGSSKKATTVAPEHPVATAEPVIATEPAPLAAEPAPIAAEPFPIAEASAAVTEPAPTDAASTASKPESSFYPPSTENSAETASINSEAFAWTAAQDAILIGMKVQDKSWKEISDTIPEKSIGELKQRFNYLELAVNANGKGKGKEVDVKGKGKEKEEGGKGKGKQEEPKAKGGKSSMKGKGKANAGKKKVRIESPETSETSEEEDAVYPDDSDSTSTGTGTNSDASGSHPVRLRRGQKPANHQLEKKGILKMVEADAEEEEPTLAKGRPIVYVEPKENMTQPQVSCSLIPFESN